MLCHGNPDGEHCCWVDSAPCQNLLQGAEIAAAVQAQISLYNLKGKKKNLANKTGQGSAFGCAVAIQVIGAEIDATGEISTRTTFEADWAAHADYQVVADHWETIGKPRAWCASFGIAENQCCFDEDQATNDTKAANVPVELRGLRNAINTLHGP